MRKRTVKTAEKSFRCQGCGGVIQKGGSFVELIEVKDALSKFKVKNVCPKCGTNAKK